MNFSTALVYVAFFGLIGFAVYCTASGWPLWALLLTPSTSTGTGGDNSESRVE